jgi:3D (Asp-Asp-Asp) domain-containing protein
LNPFIPAVALLIALHQPLTVKADSLSVEKLKTEYGDCSALESTTMYCKADGAGVFLLPDDRIDPIDRAYVNTTFEVLKISGEWAAVATCDGVAYVKAADLQAEPVKQWRSLGVKRITHYDACGACGTGNGITASGRKAQIGRTIAVHKSVAPIGAHIMINGREYIVDDRGVGPGTVDIFVGSHSEAKRLGTYKAEIFILENQK